MPDEELHRFHNQQTGEMGAHLCGRRLYEVMLYWETADENPAAAEHVLEFARIWKNRAEGRVLEDTRARRGQCQAGPGTELSKRSRG